MRKVTITRTETDDCGTFGQMTTDSGFSCYAGELPWRNNLPGFSCIPAGTYKCARGNSPKHGPCYYVQNVKDRTDVEIHSANWMGDVIKHLKCQLLGCIAPGRAIMDVAGQKGVASSKDALAGFEADLDNEDFELTIRWAEGIGPKEA